MQLRLSTRTVDGVLVVDGSGRIVFGEESASLRDAVKKLLSESPKVVLNLRDVTYIDSGGLGTLVSLYTTAKNAGGALKLASLTQRVDDLLQVTKLVTIFEVFENEQAAVASFKSAASIFRGLVRGPNSFMIPKILFLVALVFAASGWASPPLALALGLAFGLIFANPYPEQTAKSSKILLQASVVGLGFGMNLHDVVRAGTEGVYLLEVKGGKYVKVQ